MESRHARVVLVRVELSWVKSWIEMSVSTFVTFNPWHLMETQRLLETQRLFEQSANTPPPAFNGDLAFIGDPACIRSFTVSCTSIMLLFLRYIVLCEMYRRRQRDRKYLTKSVSICWLLTMRRNISLVPSKMKRELGWEIFCYFFCQCFEQGWQFFAEWWGKDFYCSKNRLMWQRIV